MKLSSDLENKTALTQEQQLFLDVIRDHLFNKSSDYEHMVDWNIIKNFADNHQVTAIFYKQTKHQMFRNAYVSQIYRYINFKDKIDFFKDTLDGHRYFMVKGAEVARLYPIPELRSMGDVDVIIPIDEREAVHQALINSGFRFQNEADGEWSYTKDGFLFEVHDALVHRREELCVLVNYFSDVWEYVSNNQLDWSYHLIYLIEHLRHHFVSQGVGFRQFMDVAVVCKKCNIDWSFVEKELKKINLFDFATTVFAFNKKWFNIDVAIKTADLSDDFYVLATQKIFADGVFGFNNEENKVADVAARMHYQKKNQGEARNKFLSQSFFPSYEYMCRLPYCNYIIKGKFLLPIAWIHRIFYRIFSKSARDNLRLQISSKKITDRMDMFHKWGL